jgi:hypothetical protein
MSEAGDLGSMGGTFCQLQVGQRLFVLLGQAAMVG